MLQRIMGTDPQLGAELQHSLQQIDTAGIDLREDLTEILGSVHLEVLLVFGELRDSGPGALRGRAHDAEDAHQLVFVGSAGEERAAAVHLGHDATSGPDVDAGVVGAGTEEDVWGAVPQRHDFVGEGVDRDAEGSGETEIGELELAFVVDEEILRLEIAVEDSVRVAEVDALEELVHEGFDGDGRQCSSISLGVHVLLQILIHVFKDQHELVLGMNDIVEADDVLVLQLLHQRDLADCSRGCAFFGIEVDLFQSYQFPSLPVSSFEDLNESDKWQTIVSSGTDGTGFAC